MVKGKIIGIFGTSCSGKSSVLDMLAPHMAICREDDEMSGLLLGKLQEELPGLYSKLTDLGLDEKWILNFFLGGLSSPHPKVQEIIKEIRLTSSFLKLKKSEVRSQLQEGLVQKVKKLADQGVNVAFDNAKKFDYPFECASVFLFCPFTVLLSRVARRNQDLISKELYYLARSATLTYWQYADFMKVRKDLSEPLLEVLEKKRVIDLFERSAKIEGTLSDEEDFLHHLGFLGESVETLEMTIKDQSFDLWLNTAILNREESAKKIIFSFLGS